MDVCRANLSGTVNDSNHNHCQGFALRIFVAEYVCGGGWTGYEVAGSLATEGRAMLGAIVDDLSSVAGVQVVTTWDARLGPHAFRNARVFVSGRGLYSRRRAYIQAIERFSRRCDATLLIAPEFDGIHFDLCRNVETIGGRLFSLRQCRRRIVHRQAEACCCS